MEGPERRDPVPLYPEKNKWQGDPAGIPQKNKTKRWISTCTWKNKNLEKAGDQSPPTTGLPSFPCPARRTRQGIRKQRQKIHDLASNTKYSYPGRSLSKIPITLKRAKTRIFEAGNWLMKGGRSDPGVYRKSSKWPGIRNGPETELGTWLLA